MLRVSFSPFKSTAESENIQQNQVKYSLLDQNYGLRGSKLYGVAIVVCMVLLKKTGCLHVPVVTNKYT